MSFGDLAKINPTAMFKDKYAGTFSHLLLKYIMEETIVNISTLKEHPEFLNKTLTLIESSFNYAQTEKFSTDFYPLMCKENHHHNFILLNNQEVISHIGVKSRILGTTPVLLIGGIATAPQHRKKGYINKLLKHIFKIFNEKISLYILWSDQISFYSKYHFYQAGGQIEGPNTKLSEEIKKKYIRTKLHQISDSDFSQIKHIYNNVTTKEVATLIRNDEDWNQIKNITSSNLYLQKENNKIVSYFLRGKGFDLPDIIHEVGYLSTAKTQTLNMLSRYSLWYPYNFSHYYKEVGQLSYTALIKIGNDKLLKQFINLYSKNKIKEISSHHGKSDITFTNKSISVTTEDLLQHIFGPHQNNHLPEINIPLYMAGCDSV